MPISKWNPVHEMNRFFDDVFDRFPARFGFDLAIDLYEDGNDLVAEMSMPGIDIEKTDVNITDDILKVCGHREEKKEKKDKNFYSREIHRGSFERSVRLPAAVDASQTNANYKDGVLTIRMPLKKPSIEQKKIEIKHG